MHGLVYMASRDKVDVDAFHKGIQYGLEKLESRNLAFKAQQYQILKAKATKALGTSLLTIPELRVLVLTKRHVGSGNEIEKRKAWFARGMRESLSQKDHWFTNP